MPTHNQDDSDGHETPSAIFGIDRLLPIDAVADILGVSKRSIYRLIARGEMPAPVKVGGVSRFPISEVQAFIDRQKAERAKRSS